MKREYETRDTNHESRMKAGSALILSVVLTSLLAIVGVTFLMVARVDKIATSSISENRELNSAVETVIAKISQKLVLDTPGVLGQEYYDYPGPRDSWLANLEPYQGMVDPNKYYWRQISDIDGTLGSDAWNLQAEIIPDYPVSYDVDVNSPSDADGDGVADSMWVKLNDITTSKGKPIYAAIRIVDNGAMLNVNTAYKFDSGETNPNLIDGSSQLQINLMALSQRGFNPDAEVRLQGYRCGSAPNDISEYEENVVWRYNEPNGLYTPFDISDELKLRNRYILNYNLMTSRIEELWENAYDGGLKVPRTKNSELSDPCGWFWKANNSSPDVNQYDYRHIATTYNMDRIINPNGAKMASINIPDVAALNDALFAGIDPNVVNRGALAAQLAVNIADFIDNNTEVTSFGPNDPNISTDTYYGFDAQPFIAEVGMNVILTPSSIDYAVELYNPFNTFTPIDLQDFELELEYSGDIRTVSFNLGDTIPAGGCFVIASKLAKFGLVSGPDTKEDSNLSFFGDWKPIDPTLPPPPVPPGSGPPAFSPTADGNLFLKRTVYTGDPNDPNNLEQIYVDKQIVDSNWVPDTSGERYFGRDDHDWHIVYQTLEESGSSLGIINNIDPTLFTGHNFSFFLPNPLNPLSRFVTVGDIPRILTIGNGTSPDSTIGEQLGEAAGESQIRLDLQNPYLRDVFQYLTVFDPSTDYIDNDGDGPKDGNDIIGPELKIPGRINVNTAPWYVIAQLPWVSHHTPNYELAWAIVAYRDKTIIDPNLSYYSGRATATGLLDLREEYGFASIGELATVINDSNDPSKRDYSMDYYDFDLIDLGGFPDLTSDVILGDGVMDDFEERDVIFSRISNLVTVRSDIFTAYILVRIGTDGPQKRVIAILDRSGVYPDGLGGVIGNVKIIALHPVPDPR